MANPVDELVHFINAYIEKRLRKIIDYKEPVRKAVKPDELRKILPLNIDNQGVDNKTLIQAIRAVIDYSVQFDHPFFMNQMFGNMQPAGLLADLLIPLLNTSIYTYEVAPAMTLIELEIIEELTSLIWHKPGDGVFTSGGSMSNMNALFLARNRHLSGSKEKGLFQEKPLRVFVSDQAHYSFTKGVNYLGLGTDALVKIPSNAQAKISVDQLEKSIVSEKEKGNDPFMLVGIAGTTISGSFDPLEALAALAEKHGLWFHVDAAFGGSFLFSDKLKQRLKGIEHADSVTWNFHKVMGMPLTAASFLTKEKDLLLRNFSVDADYLFKKPYQNYDLGQKSLQGGRRPDAFKLWLSWKYAGKKAFAHHVESLHDIALRFARFVLETPHFELYTEPETAIVCFRYVPQGKTADAVDACNIQIREKVIDTGQMVFNYSYLNRRVFLRCVFLDPHLSDEKLKYILTHIVSIVNTL